MMASIGSDPYAAEFAISDAAANNKTLGQSATPDTKSSIGVLSPRLFLEISPSANTSKGFLIVATKVAPQRRKFAAIADYRLSD